jgi:hypothetical protein
LKAFVGDANLCRLLLLQQIQCNSTDGGEVFVAMVGTHPALVLVKGITAPVMSSIASSLGTAVISLLFSSTADWHKTNESSTQ